MGLAVIASPEKFHSSSTTVHCQFNFFPLIKECHIVHFICLYLMLWNICKKKFVSVFTHQPLYLKLISQKICLAMLLRNDKTQRALS